MFDVAPKLNKTQNDSVSMNTCYYIFTQIHGHMFDTKSKPQGKLWTLVTMCQCRVSDCGKYKGSTLEVHVLMTVLV